MQRSSLVRSGVLAMCGLLLVGLVSWAQQPAASRSYLGVFIGPNQEQGAGLMVLEVTPGSPAAKAGIQPGDRILKLGNDKVQDAQKFLQTVAAKKPGEKLNLGIVRGGKEQTLTVILAERPTLQAPSLPEFPGFRRSAFLGVQMQPLTPELKKRLNVEAQGGAVLVDVAPKSPAAKAGLKRDDVITAVGNRPVNNPMDLRDAIQQNGAGKEVVLQVIRGKEKLSMKATPRAAGASGYFLPPEERLSTIDMDSMFDQPGRIRDLERRIGELEKRLRDLEKK